MTSTKTRRIGPGMLAAQEFVAANPGCRKLAAAKHVGPHGSTKYGYEIVDRAISAGLINAQYTPRGYVLTVSA